MEVARIVEYPMNLSFEDIASTYPVVFLDTCALINELSIYSSGTSEAAHIRAKSALFYKEQLEKFGNIFVTLDVFLEYKRMFSKFKESKLRKAYGGCSYTLDLAKFVGGAKKIKRDLTDKLVDCIVDLEKFLKMKLIP